MREFIIAGRRV